MNAVPSLDSRVVSLLRTGSRNMHALCQALGISTPTMEHTLQRMKREGRVRHRGELWGLPHTPTDTEERAKGVSPIGTTQRQALMYLVQHPLSFAALTIKTGAPRTHLERAMQGLVKRRLVVFVDGIYAVTETGEATVMEARAG